MNKSELIKAVVDATGLTTAAASKAVDATLAAVTEALKRGDQVTLIGFGTFSVRDRKARTGRDPRTGNTIEIQASRVPGFKPGKGLKDAVK